MVAPENFVFCNPIKNDLCLKIIRSSDGTGRDRYCQNAENEVIPHKISPLIYQETIYYCEVAPDAKTIIHRGHKDGPIIATAVPCFLDNGATDLHFKEPQSTIHLKHIYRKGFPTKTQFRLNDVEYHWEEENELLQTKTATVMAQFYRSEHPEDESEHMLGKLIVKERGQQLMEIAVITTFIAQARCAERQS